MARKMCFDSNNTHIPLILSEWFQIADNKGNIKSSEQSWALSLAHLNVQVPLILE